MGQAHPRHCLNPAATSFAERPAHRPSTPQKRAAAGEENKTAEWLQAKGVLPPWFEQRESGGAQGWLALPEQSQPRWCVLDPLGTLSIFGGSGGGSGGGGGGSSSGVTTTEVVRAGGFDGGDGGGGGA